MSDEQNQSQKRTLSAARNGVNHPVGSAQLDLAGLGLESTVYLKNTRVDDTDGVAVHAADGEVIAYAQSTAEAAFWAFSEGFAVAALH